MRPIPQTLTVLICWDERMFWHSSAKEGEKRRKRKKKKTQIKKKEEWWGDSEKRKRREGTEGGRMKGRRSRSKAGLQAEHPYPGAAGPPCSPPSGARPGAVLEGLASGRANREYRTQDACGTR